MKVKAVLTVDAQSVKWVVHRLGMVAASLAGAVHPLEVGHREIRDIDGEYVGELRIVEEEQPHAFVPPSEGQIRAGYLLFHCGKCQQPEAKHFDATGKPVEPTAPADVTRQLYDRVVDRKAHCICTTSTKRARKSCGSCKADDAVLIQARVAFREGTQPADVNAEMLQALRSTLAPLVRLGDFIGNKEDNPPHGIEPYDRCAVIGAVKDAIARAEQAQKGYGK